MKSWAKFFWVYLLAIAFILPACSERGEQQPDIAQEATSEIVRPDFSADSAYAYIARQVGFGPRVPGTKAHKACAAWLVSQLEAFGWEVTTQNVTLTAWDGTQLPAINIIGSINPDASRRFLLGAHWDTRPWADQDAVNTYEPFDGANDGASGVGVLLEIARQLAMDKPAFGVDIIFFDAEDYGVSGEEDSYCLGSQYWAQNPHIAYYKAQKGILLDMVGARGAKFAMEGTSMNIAPDFMRHVWNIAHDLGHGKHFIYRRTNPIIDDHLYVHRYLRIPMINIIQYDPSSRTGFGDYWHTHDDNMSIIHRPTLQAVGETVLAVLQQF